MKKLLQSEGREALYALASKRGLCAFDFDGTLVPITRNLRSPRLSRRTERLLRQLHAIVPVVVISGRSVSDLASRVPLPRSCLIGNHGLEEGLRSASTRPLQRARAAVRDWVVALKRADLGRGVEIEDKRYSVSVHYRRAPYRAAAKRKIERAIQSLPGPKARVVPGKAVLSLVYPSAPNKGDALARYARSVGARAVLYVGDDETDEDVFSRSASGWIKARVGTGRRTAAEFCLPRRSEVDRLLRLLIDAHIAEKEKAPFPGKREGGFRRLRNP